MRSRQLFGIFPYNLRLLFFSADTQLGMSGVLDSIHTIAPCATYSGKQRRKGCTNPPTQSWHGCLLFADLSWTSSIGIP